MNYLGGSSSSLEDNAIIRRTWFRSVSLKSSEMDEQRRGEREANKWPGSGRINKVSSPRVRFVQWAVETVKGELNFYPFMLESFYVSVQIFFLDFSSITRNSIQIHLLVSGIALEWISKNLYFFLEISSQRTKKRFLIRYSRRIYLLIANLRRSGHVLVPQSLLQQMVGFIISELQRHPLGNWCNFLSEKSNRLIGLWH